MNVFKSILLAGVVLFSGCLKDNDTPSKEINGTMFRHNNLGFSMDLPAGWTNKIDDEVSGQKVEVTSKNVPQGNIAANIVVMASPTSGMTSMSQIIPWYKSQTTNAFPGVEFLSDTIYTTGGVEVGKVVYKGEMFGNSLKFKELFFIRNNKDVQIVFTDLETYFDTRQEFVTSESSLSFH